MPPTPQQGAVHVVSRSQGHPVSDGHPEHTCPYGLKAKDLLERQGFEVEDHLLTDRAETDRFKAEHQVKSTPQTFINGERVGGFDDLQRHFGKAANDPNATTYTPVIAVFSMTALMALAASYTPCTARR